MQQDTETTSTEKAVDGHPGEASTGLRKTSDGPCFSFDDRDLWSWYSSMPNKEYKWNPRILIWGHVGFGREFINRAPSDDFDTAFRRIWFAFSVNLLSRILYCHFFALRVYVVRQLCNRVDWYDRDALNRQLVKNQHGWPVLLHMKHLTDMPAETDKERRFHELSRKRMPENADSFVRMVEWVETYAGRGVYRIKDLIRERIDTDEFLKEISGDETKPSGSFRLELKKRLNHTP